MSHLTIPFWNETILHTRKFKMEANWYLRWKQCKNENSSGKLYGAKIIKNADGSLTYDRQIIENRSLGAKYVLFPIPQSEIDKNGNLQQNPGY